jgi:N-acetylglucosamine kinase-like BadF-type ATPase
MRYFLGVDGGNSKTLAVVGDETGRVLGMGRSGGSNHQGIGLPMAMDRIREPSETAFAMAGLAPSQISAAFYALAGADLPEDFELLQPAMVRLDLAADAAVDNDSIASLRSGSDEPNAVVVGWGAGVNGAGRNAFGKAVRLPALGWYSGDWGGGGDLGQEAIFLVARAHDLRGEPTALTGPILKALGVQDVDEMVSRIYHSDERRVDVGGLAPIVFSVANAGDRVARQLVERSGVEIAVTARALLRRLDLIATPADVVLAGSVFKAECSLLMDTVRTQLAEMAPKARIVRPNVEPVIGALFCAMDMAHVPVDGGTRQLAERSYEGLFGSVAEEVRSA